MEPAMLKMPVITSWLQVKEQPNEQDEQPRAYLFGRYSVRRTASGCQVALAGFRGRHGRGQGPTFWRGRYGDIHGTFEESHHAALSPSAANWPSPPTIRGAHSLGVTEFLSQFVRGQV